MELPSLGLAQIWPGAAEPDDETRGSSLLLQQGPTRKISGFRVPVPCPAEVFQFCKQPYECECTLHQCTTDDGLQRSQVLAYERPYSLYAVPRRRENLRFVL
eukprot:scaffold458096_cov19-Prasinocladus_malaysianus.AAC.1